ncbi:RNA polymerase sigma factor [Aegicerativicinus sediminis]|uniref:RNA polymerase sigma factor n=1 Tax=Aegicerativicinus sediminis TaxID=2893202 RepID=UPI001E363E36|nr:RNA polymerase sigma factor [Aegicerativicinus sediminis]
MKVIQLNRNGKNLIKKAKKQDREAQHLIYEIHAPKMLSVCRYYIKDVQVAESVMLKGFFKVFTKIDQFREEGSFEGWIRRIMVREAISHIRSNKRIEYSIEEVKSPHETTNNIEVSMGVEQIQAIIDELPEGYKMVFVMYAIEGYKHQEIAEILGISESTSKTQLFKARKMLQDKIKMLNTTSYGTN